MTRDRAARALTLAVLAGVLALVVARRGSPPPGPVRPPAAKADRSPQDAIYAMLDAARSGDVPAYLGCYTGQMETALRRTLAESTPEGFAAYLKRQNAPVKGIAVNEPEPVTETESQVRVEFVYQDHNEVQIMYLRKTSSGWKIDRVETSERIQSPVPYGAPAETR
jgi:hypothetical protein